jgi:fido (protein-threonine AMPylation protein)
MTDPSRWVSERDQITRLGLLPDIRTAEDYDRESSAGIERARSFCVGPNAENTESVPTLSMISNVHRMIFGDIYPWSGQLREPGQRVTVGITRSSGASPVQILFELELAR